MKSFSRSEVKDQGHSSEVRCNVNSCSAASWG